MIDFERSKLTNRSDISRAFPNGEHANLFREEWLTSMSKEIRNNREFSERTTSTARWAREQIKRQIGMTSDNFFTQPFWGNFGGAMVH
jgi:importin subunit beta-1